MSQQERDAIRREGTPEIQDKLDAVEEWIDFAFGKNAKEPPK